VTSVPAQDERRAMLSFHRGPWGGGKKNERFATQEKRDGYRETRLGFRTEKQPPQNTEKKCSQQAKNLPRSSTQA